LTTSSKGSWGHRLDLGNDFVILREVKPGNRLFAEIVESISVQEVTKIYLGFP